MDDDNLEIPEYKLVRSDHPSNNKRGIAFKYYKIALPSKVIDICLLQEYKCFEVMLNEKRCNFVVFYRSPSHNQDEFYSFSDNLELTLDKPAHNNPILLVVIGDLNGN